MDFSQKPVTMSWFGNKEMPAKFTSSGHPVTSLLEFPDKHEAFPVMQSESDEDTGTGSTVETVSESTSEFYGSCEDDDDMPCLTETSSIPDRTEYDNISDTTSESSHEAEFFETESGDDEAVDLEGYAAEVFSKGARKRVQRHLDEIQEAFSLQQERTGESNRQEIRKKLKQQPLRQKRRAGPWRVMEIFTWTCMISIVAAVHGWIASEPMTLPRFDLADYSVQRDVWQRIEKFDPDLIVTAWPCHPWSQLQQCSKGKPWHERELELKRQESRILLNFTQEVVSWQAERGRAVLGENPWKSDAWQEPPIQAAFERPGLSSALVDMCCHGKQRPDNGMPIRKRTLVKGTPEICEAVASTCPANHTHGKSDGSMNVNGKTVRVAEWSGGYTKEFATKVILGAETFLE